MTTIATDGKSMAGDSLTTAGTHAVRHAPKVHRLKDGRIVGACGLTAECLKIVRWLDDGGDKPDISDETEALVLGLDGTVCHIDHKFEMLEYDVPAGIGSGSDLAIGAILAGASPEAAVGIACVRDRHSGGDITVLHLNGPLRAVA